MDYVERLRLACQASGMGATELARKADVEQSNLNKFINNDRGIGLEAGLRVYAALGYRLVKGGEETTGGGAGFEPQAYKVALRPLEDGLLPLGDGLGLLKSRDSSPST